MIRNKKIIISIIAILLIVLLGTSYFIVQMLENKNQDNKENNKLNYEIKLKLDEEGDEYNCSLPNSNCTIYKIKTETKDAKILSYTDYKNKYVFILYDDNGLKIYDAKKEETQELNLKNDYDGNYELFSNQDKDNRNNLS